MSNTKNIFDDFLERKMQEKMFEEKDSYWEQARELIDADRKKLRRKKVFFWTGFSTVFSSVLVLSVLMLNTTETTDNKQSAILTPAETPAAITSETAPGITPVHTTTTVSSTAKKETAQVKNNAPDVTEKTTQPTSRSEQNHIQQTTKKTAALIAETSVHQTTNDVAAPVNEKTFSPVTATTRTPSKPVIKKQRSNKQKTKNNLITNKEPVAFIDASIKKETIKTSTEDKAGSSALNVSRPAMPVNARHQDVQQLMHNKPSLLALIPDSSYVMKDVTITPPVNYTTPLYIAVEAGITHYNAKGLFASEQFATYAGLSYTRFVSSKIGFSGGLTFSMLKQDLSRSYVVKQYGFGEKVNRTSINTIELDYIELPLKMYYHVFGRHYLNAGATFAYLIQSKDRLVTLGDEKKETNTSGFTKAILPYDIQLSLGYSVAINQRFVLNVAYYYGLNDVSKNSLFKSSATDRNEGYRLGISYKLFNHEQ